MLELQGMARRVGAGACTLTLVGLCLGAIAPASFAAERDKPAKASEQTAHPEKSKKVEKTKKAERHTHKAHKARTSSTPKAVKGLKATHWAAPHAASSVQPAKHLEAPQIKLDDLLLPGALSQTTTANTLVRRPSALLVVPAAATPAGATPETTVPDAAAPEVSVVVKKAHKTKTGNVSTATVSASALLDVRALAPVTARSVVAPRGLVSAPTGSRLSQVAGAQAVVASAGATRAASALRAAAPVQVVNRELPRMGAWPTGPVFVQPGTAGLPFVALGGFVLALAAARGVGRMRHPRADDPDLSFPSS